MSALVEAYAEAERLPKMLRRERLCELAPYGYFCAFCSDVDDIPCVKAGAAQDCDECTEQGCPCMVGWTRERRAAAKAWKARYDKSESVTRERAARYHPRRKAGNAARRRKGKYHMKLARICAADGCEKAITDQSKSGLCVEHCRVGKVRGPYRRRA